MLKNYILKVLPNIQNQKDVLIPKLQKDFESFFDNKNWDFTDKDSQLIELINSNVDERKTINKLHSIEKERYLLKLSNPGKGQY